jgi:hypothetical protein
MEVRFPVVVKWNPDLGPHEEPYALFLYIGGLEHTVISKKLTVVKGHADNPLVEFVIPAPKGHRAGEPFLPIDTALMVIGFCTANSEDDSHRHKLGVNEAGTACFPLKNVLKSTQGNTVATQDLVVYNARVANPQYLGTKGPLELTFGQPTFPMGRDPWLPENEFTVDHEAEFKSPLIQAVIQASMHFGMNTQCRFQSIQELPGLPPYQFHQYFIPGQMLAAKRSSMPMKEEWWKALINMGLQRTHPDMDLETARIFVEEIGSERDKMAVFFNSMVTPCNYWRYYPDQTEDKKLGLIPMEAYGLTSRAKCGIVGGKMYSPLQDCEDDEEDVSKLGREFQNPKIHSFKTPLLREIQDVSQDYVVVQGLCGVNGQQQSDGKQNDNAKVDPYSKLGGHEVAVLFRKSTFVKLVGRLNKNRPLFEDWAQKYDPDAPFVFPEDQPMIGEGTGDVDPLGGGYRSNLLDTYRYLMMGNKTPVFEHWKLVQWQQVTEINDFYRCFLGFVVPELFDQGYGHASFTAMSLDPKTKTWVRGFSYQDLMRPHANIGLRIDPAMSETQARTVRRVASFYPPVLQYELPGPAENCPVRTKLVTRMKKITQTMASLNRRLPEKEGATLTADFYPTYYQLTKQHIQGICEMIKEKPQILDVKVQEEAITTGLGGFRVAFTVAMTEKPKQLIRQLQSKIDQGERWKLENPQTLKEQFEEIENRRLASQAFWKSK